MNITLLLSALACSAWARPALAEAPVAPLVGAGSFAAPLPARPLRQPGLELSLPASTLLWATPRANVASLLPLLPLPLRPRLGLYAGGSRPLRVSGGVVLGLGIMTLFGAGITGIVAAAQSSRLNDDCPGKVCYEGTRGADRLQSVRDTALAADWLLGIGAPVTASGMILLLYSAVVERSGLVVSPSPVFRASPGGLTFDF